MFNFNIHINMFNKFIIYKDNLINNIKQVKSENQNSKICAMVKANAYGVGDCEVVKILENYVDFYGVACFFEAQKISVITNKKILIVGALEKENINENFSYSCSEIEDVKYLSSLNKRINIHLKVNTGMNRFGFKDIKEFKNVLGIIKNSKLNFEGLFTHFATSDEKVEEQMTVLNKFIKIVRKHGFNPIIHADNSFVNEKYNHHLNMVRVGFNLYAQSSGWFLPVTEIKTKVVQIQDVKKGELVGYNYRYVASKNVKVAIIPIGYADGFNLKNIGLELNLNGNLCKVLNVCMDCFMADVTNSNIKKGDEVFILNKFNSLTKYAEHLQTTEYEVLTNFSNIRAEKIIN